MKAFPDSDSLKAFKFTSVLGLFPWKLTFQQNKFYQTLYYWYSLFVLCWDIGFVFTSYVELVILLRGEVLNIEEICTNIRITTIYTCIIIRLVMIRTSSGLLNLIQEIIDSDKQVTNMDDEETTKLVKKDTSNNNLKFIWYVSICCSIGLQFFIRPLVTEPETIQIGNTTVVAPKDLIILTWFPFDEQKYYWVAYFLQVIDGIIGTLFVALSDVFIVNLILYPTTQLKKIQYIFRNFEYYQQSYKTLNVGETEESAGIKVITELVQRHQRIIKFVDTFNGWMGPLMVFDFLQSSIQIASILISDLRRDITFAMVCFIVTFFVGMVLRLYLHYYSANELILESQKLADAIWYSNWYEQSPKIKYLMLIVIIRAQKSLKYNIGAFGIMSLESGIAILKATYTYITVFTSNN